MKRALFWLLVIPAILIMVIGYNIGRLKARLTHQTDVL